MFVNELLKKKSITFGGDDDTIAWVFQASDQKDANIVAEPPFEVVKVENGTIAHKFQSEKVEHKKMKEGVCKYIFVNVKRPCQSAWGTPRKLEYQDAASGRIVSIGANGFLTLCINDSVKFIERVLGVRNALTADELTEEMLPKIMDSFNEHLLAIITENGIGYAAMDGLLKEIGQRLLVKLNPAMESYGIVIGDFIIGSLVKPEGVKELTNLRAKRNEDFVDEQLRKDRDLALLGKEEQIEAQEQKILRNRADHVADVRLVEGKTDAELERMQYEDAKGASYKEIRELDLADKIATLDGIANIQDKIKSPEVNIINILSESGGVCPYCGGEITANQIFCPTCRKKLT